MSQHKTESEPLTLTVLSGPDAGVTLSFRKEKITLGRDQSNDFVLSDGFVSNRHGEIFVNPDSLKYVDLKSRHGSLVIVNNISTHLHHPNTTGGARLADISEIQLGCSVIRITRLVLPDSISEAIESNSISVQGVAPRIEERKATNPKLEDPNISEPRMGEARSGEHFITVALHPATKMSAALSTKDKGMEVIFNLVKNLNSYNSLEAVIRDINKAAFDAFSSANFFSITLGETPEEVETTQPFLTTDRDGDDDAMPILSRSILRQAAQTEESILWVKDSMGMDVSKSIVDAKIDSCLCAPLIGQSGLLGVMQVDTRGRGSLFGKNDLNLFNVLASSAAFAVERAKLSNNIVRMFEGFVEASVTAIEARDPTTAGHSHRVAEYTVTLAEATNRSNDSVYGDFSLSTDQLTELRYAALLHDFGKIAVNENVLNKATRISELNMSLISRRFDLVKVLEHNNALKMFAQSVEKNEPPSLSIEQINVNYRRFCSYLDEKLEWLEKCNRLGFLSDEDIASLKEFAANTFLDQRGVNRPYLSTAEVENLTIRRGNLNEEEWKNMRSHAARSEEYLTRIPWSPALKNVPCIAGRHHEKLDGSGYPLGLLADEISAQVRMLTIADIFDALTAADRPYRKAATIDKAAKILTEEAQESKLDTVLVSTFLNVVIPKIIHLVPSLTKSN